MIDKYIALGIKHVFGDNKQLKHGILTCEYEPWNIGTPLMVEAQSYNNYRSNGMSIRALTLMYGSTRTSGAGYSFTPPANGIIPVELRPILDNHKVMEIDRFLFNKFGRLISYVHDIGSISFLLTSKPSQIAFARDFGHLCKMFQYHTVTYAGNWIGQRYLASEKDRKYILLSLFDIPYVMALFNTRCVDGIGISASVITEDASIKYGQPHKIASLEVLLSNYEENLFHVDGQRVNDTNLLSGEYLSFFEEAARMDMAVGGMDKTSPYSNYKSAYKAVPSYTEWKLMSDENLAFSSSNSQTEINISDGANSGYYTTYNTITTGGTED